MQRAPAGRVCRPSELCCVCRASGAGCVWRAIGAVLCLEGDRSCAVSAGRWELCCVWRAIGAGCVWRAIEAVLCLEGHRSGLCLEGQRCGLCLPGDGSCAVSAGPSELCCVCRASGAVLRSIPGGEGPRRWPASGRVGRRVMVSTRRRGCTSRQLRGMRIRVASAQVCATLGGHNLRHLRPDMGPKNWMSC